MKDIKHYNTGWRAKLWFLFFGKAPTVKVGRSSSLVWRGYYE